MVYNSAFSVTVFIGMPVMDKAFILRQLDTALATCSSLTVLEHIKADFLGKKGCVTELLKQLRALPLDERPLAGQKINELKQVVLERMDSARNALEQMLVADALQRDTIDVSLPGRSVESGSHHPVSLATAKMVAFFTAAGFMVMQGPEIEDDYHNFTALNVPEHHPARAMHDTFYVDSPFDVNLLLRTHTSSVQIRALETQTVPLRVITPGRVYRCDSDLTHTPMFHQLEGLVIDKTSTFADLKGLLLAFMENFFNKRCEIRLRPSYFPFTEPSAEVDVRCVLCDGAGCRVCKHTGWLEVLGCGMVHPSVLETAGIDTDAYSGFAFGLGIDRFAMLAYQIPDLRMMFDNDIRFLRQFS